MSAPWSAPILGTPVTNVIAGGEFVRLPSGDAGTLLQAGVLMDVSNTWRTMYPDAEMYDGGGVIGGDGGPVLAVNEDPQLIPEIPQAPDVARELGELNDYLRQQTAEYWRKAEAQEADTQRRIEQLRADTQREADERMQRTRQIIDDLERERDRMQAEIELFQLQERMKADAEHFDRENRALLEGFAAAVKAAKAGALSRTAGDLRAAGIGSAPSGGDTGAGSGSSAGGGKDKPKTETEADHAAHRAAGRRIQEEAARRAQRDGPQAAREWAKQEAARYQSENPEGQPENPNFWSGYTASGLIDPANPLGGDAGDAEKDGGLFWVLLAAAALYSESKRP